MLVGVCLSALMNQADLFKLCGQQEESALRLAKHLQVRETWWSNSKLPLCWNNTCGTNRCSSGTCVRLHSTEWWCLNNILLYCDWSTIRMMHLTSISPVANNLWVFSGWLSGPYWTWATVFLYLNYLQTTDLNCSPVITPHCPFLL